MAKRKWYERTVVEEQSFQPYTRMDILVLWHLLGNFIEVHPGILASPVFLENRSRFHL